MDERLEQDESDYDDLLEETKGSDDDCDDDLLEETKGSDDDGDNDEAQENGISGLRNKKRLREESAAAQKRGVCYLSRVPPHMNPTKLRQILSRFGDVLRIYLAPENPTVQIRRKQAGGFRGKEFCEGWVEFTKRSVAKNVANMLNGEQIGGKKRSSFYYDIWNIKYLRKFKWEDLTNETATNKRAKAQKFALEISAATRERDFYLKKVDQSRALSSIKERIKKKQKNLVPESSEGAKTEEPPPKVIRRFPQNRPFVESSVQSKPRLSKDILSSVFNGGS